ncbi:hypothetical protein NCCP2222_28100 [Sporosarcina sp. NCCP-2222]|nr:hypothetical protein NCCP2222_28100 [Sporosarcina sp. NCCP-2222]
MVREQKREVTRTNRAVQKKTEAAFAKQDFLKTVLETLDDYKHAVLRSIEHLIKYVRALPDKFKHSSS